MTSRQGGCLGKVDSTSLLALLANAGFGVGSRSGFRDSDVTEVPGVGTLATSTDLIYDIGLEPTDFGWVAATHALSDSYAVLATPIIATISLGTSPLALRSGSAAGVLSGAAAALKANAAAIGGGHTVYANPPFLSVTVVGLAPSTDLSLIEDQDYTLLLSKPLGSGVYISAMRNQLLQPRDVSELVEVLRESNANAAVSLRDLLAQERSAIGFVTDVTGFGLLLGVQAKLAEGWEATIEYDRVPFLSQAIAMFCDHGITTGLGEQNMFTADRDDGFQLTRVPLHARLALSDPQTSGGLVAAIRTGLARQLISGQLVDWSPIGEVRFTQDGAQPKLIVM